MSCSSFFFFFFFFFSSFSFLVHFTLFYDFIQPFLSFHVSSSLTLLFRVAVTNKKNNLHYNVCYNPYSPGQKLCNLFYPSNDCVYVDNNGCVPVYLNGGESKIFYPV